MNARLRKFLDWTIGLILIGIGIVGGFVPILQGWVFILAGLAVLSSHSRFAKALYERAKGVGRSIRSRVHARRERRASREPEES